MRSDPLSRVVPRILVIFCRYNVIIVSFVHRRPSLTHTILAAIKTHLFVNI